MERPSHCREDEDVDLEALHLAKQSEELSLIAAEGLERGVCPVASRLWLQVESLNEGKKCLALSTGECSVTGDMYFQSFDERIFTFPATCQYVLAKSRNSGKFTVTIQNAPCGAVSYV